MFLLFSCYLVLASMFYTVFLFAAFYQENFTSYGNAKHIQIPCCAAFRWARQYTAFLARIRPVTWRVCSVLSLFCIFCAGINRVFASGELFSLQLGSSTCIICIRFVEEVASQLLLDKTFCRFLLVRTACADVKMFGSVCMKLCGLFLTSPGRICFTMAYPDALYSK